MDYYRPENVLLQQRYKQIKLTKTQEQITLVENLEKIKTNGYYNSIVIQKADAELLKTRNARKIIDYVRKNELDKVNIIYGANNRSQFINILPLSKQNQSITSTNRPIVIKLYTELDSSLKKRIFEKWLEGLKREFRIKKVHKQPVLSEEDRGIKYIIYVTSTYYSNEIEEAIDNYEPNKRAIRIRELIAVGYYDRLLTNLESGETYSNHIHSKVTNSDEYKFKKPPPIMAGQWTETMYLDINSKKGATGTVFYLIPGSISDKELKIVRKEYGTIARKEKDYYLKEMTTPEEKFWSGVSYAFLVIPKINVPIALTKLGVIGVGVWSISIDLKVGAGFGYSFSGSIGFAIDSHNNFAIVASYSGYLSFLFAVAGSSDISKGENLYAGGDASVGETFTMTNFNHVKELTNDVQVKMIDIPVIPLSFSFIYDNKLRGIAVSIAVSTPLGGLGGRKESTNVYAFTKRDVEIFYYTYLLIRKREKELKNAGKAYDIRIQTKELKKGNEITKRTNVYIVYLTDPTDNKYTKDDILNN